MLFVSEMTILSPHLDDAVLSLWHRIEQPSSHVITIFAGVPIGVQPSSWDLRTGFHDATEAVLARRKENQIALAGTETTVTNLDYLDYPYDSSPRNVTEMTSTVWHAASVDAVFFAAAGIARYGRRVHPDHITTRDIGRRIVELGRNVLFYAEYPYAYPFILYPHWPEHIPVEGLKRALQMNVEIEPYELTREQQARKRQAAERYGSQYPVIMEHNFGVMKRREAFRWEIILRPS